MVALILVALAAADPGALRVGGQDGAVVVGRATSAMVALDSGLQLAAWSRTGGRIAPISAAGLAAGWSVQRPGKREVAGWELGVSGGPTVPVLAPALALSVTPYARRWRTVGQGALSASASVPAVVRLTSGLEARVPLQAEVVGVGRVGRSRLGAVVGGGAVLSPGGFALDGQLGVVVMR